MINGGTLSNRWLVVVGAILFNSVWAQFTPGQYSQNHWLKPAGQKPKHRQCSRRD